MKLKKRRERKKKEDGGWYLFGLYTYLFMGKDTMAWYIWSPIAIGTLLSTCWNMYDFSSRSARYNRITPIAYMRACSVVSHSLRPHGPHQAPLSIGLFRWKYWSGLPCPPPGDLPNPRFDPASPALQVGSLPLSHQGSPTTITFQEYQINLNLLTMLPISQRHGTMKEMVRRAYHG